MPNRQRLPQLPSVKQLQNMFNGFVARVSIFIFGDPRAENKRKHKAMKTSSKLRAVPHFAQGELLSDLAYYLHARTKTKTVIDEDGSAREYQVHKIPTATPGLYGFILYPGADQIQQGNSRVHVVFRGTDDFAAVKRDTNLCGPGSDAFAIDKGRIVYSVKKVLSQVQRFSNNPVTLNVAGHSLGGADTQNCVVALLENMVKETKVNPLRKIKSLNIMTRNAAGVTDHTATQASSYLRQVKGTMPDLEVNQYITHLLGDAIQLGGDATIFSNEDPDMVNTYLLEVNRNASKLNLANIKRNHTVQLFSSFANEDLDFHVYHNQNPEERKTIAHHLTTKLTAGVSRRIRTIGTLLHKMYKSEPIFQHTVTPVSTKKNQND